MAYTCAVCGRSNKKEYAGIMSESGKERELYATTRRGKLSDVILNITKHDDLKGKMLCGICKDVICEEFNEFFGSGQYVSKWGKKA